MARFKIFFMCCCQHCGRCVERDTEVERCFLMFQGPQPKWRFRKALADLSQPPATLLESSARVAAMNIINFNLEDIYGLPPDLAQVLVQHLMVQKRLNYYTLSLFRTQFLYTLDLSGCNEVSNAWLALVVNSPLQFLNLEGCRQVQIRL